MLDREQGRSTWAVGANQLQLEMAWSLVPDRDRLLFHQFCCLSWKSEAHLDAVERITEILKPVLDL